MTHEGMHQAVEANVILDVMDTIVEHPTPQYEGRNAGASVRRLLGRMLLLLLLGLVAQTTLGLVDDAHAQSIFGPNLSEVVEEFEDTADNYEDDLIDLGRQLFWILFGIQFLLIGLNLLVRGPMALSANSVIGFSNPLANLFFYFIFGVLAWMLVYTAGPWTSGANSGDGWVRNLFEVFDGVGRDINGCSPAPASCAEPDDLLWIGLQLGGGVLSKVASSGADSNSALTWVMQALGTAMLASIAYAVLAVHLALTQTVFELMIAAAPLFIAMVIFRPMSSLTSGYLNFIVYLGVKLLILYILASVASAIGFNWVAFLATLLLSTVGLADLVLFNFQLVGAGLFLLAMAVYLPGRAASMVTQRLNLDIYSFLSSNPMT